MTLGSLWNYYRDEIDGANDNCSVNHSNTRQPPRAPQPPPDRNGLQPPQPQ